MDLNAIQTALKNAGFDGWLFYDFHNRDAVAARILEMDAKRFTSRRWFYYIPAEGQPQKLVHAIEPWKCDHLPGDKHIYLPWKQQHELLADILKGQKKVAMQYSPDNAIPYVSIVDGGTIELVRNLGVEVVSSADLVSQFESHLTDDDIRSHAEAGKVMQMVKNEAFSEIARRIKAGQNPKEYEIQAFMHDLMHKNDMTWEDGPVVAVNTHAADPHFEPTPQNSDEMKEGDVVLIDLWAKKVTEGSIYYDVTWMGYIGEEVPEEVENYFQIIRRARDKGHEMVKTAFDEGREIHGWEVDDAVRSVVREADLGEYFIHRTGHNIGEEVHGNGAHIDNLETKDERKIIKGSCFSLEPGIYMPDRKMGFRTEIDVVVTNEGTVEVYGEIQEKVLPLLKMD
jgi:Xaa-Pro aminopeptidase